MTWSLQHLKVITTPVGMHWVSASGNNSPWASADSASCWILSLSASSCSFCASALTSPNSFRKLFLHLNPLKTVQKKAMVRKIMQLMPLYFLREERWVIVLHLVQSPQHLNHTNKEQWKLYCEQVDKTCLLLCKLLDHRFIGIKLQIYALISNTRALNT